MDIIIVDPHFSSLYPDNEFNLSLGLVRLGHKVTIYTSSRFPPRFFGRKRTVVSEEKINGFRVVRAPVLFDVKEIPIMPSFSSLLKKEEPDVFHAQEYYQYCSLQAFNVSKKRNIPFIFSQHRHYYPSGPDKMVFKLCEQVLWRRVIYHADRITAITRVAKEFLIKNYGVLPGKIDVIPHGVNTDFFHPKLDKYYFRKRLGLTEEPLILCVARLVHTKGIEYLIRAMAKVVMKKSDAKLMIVGRGKNESYFKKIAEALNLSESIFFITEYIPLNEMALVYASADIFVLLTLKDILPISMLEAMACGLPVISTAVGGIPDILRNEKNGCLVKPYDIDGVSGKILDLIDDAKLARKFSVEARESAKREFSHVEVARRTVEAYKKAIKT